MKKVLVLISLVLMASSVFAYDGWSSGAITKLRYQQSGTLVTQPGAENPRGCSDTRYLLLKDNNDDFTRRANAALLAGKVSGSNISLAVLGCSGSGTAGFPVISEVWLND